MTSINTNPKEFQIKLKYKVGSEYHYIILDKFTYETIRDSNMIDKEKQIVREKMKIDNPTKNWNNNVEDYDKLKEHLNIKDKKNYKFYIPLSTFYFNFDNLRGFFNKQLEILSDKSQFSKNIDKSHAINDRISQLLSNTQLTTNINNLISYKISSNKDNKDNKFNIFTLTYNSEDFDKLFNKNILSTMGYYPPKITDSQDKKYLLHRYLYLIFYIDLESFFRRHNLIIDLTSDEIFTNKSSEIFFEMCKQDKILLFESLESLKILNNNLIYLNNKILMSNTDSDYQKIPKITANNKLFKIYELLNMEDPIQKFIFNKIDSAIDFIYRTYNKDIGSELQRYKKYLENNSNFFIKCEEEKSDNRINKYFESLEKNFIENEAIKDLRSVRYSSKFIPKYNTDNGRKEIIKEYGKYILSDEYYENSDIDKLYSILRSDTIRLSYIITYYNIFKILETFYLTNGCILHEKIFQQIFNQEDGENEIKKSKKKIYVRVKSLKCIKYTEDLLRESFEDDKILTPIYEIEFEEIPIHSNLIFYINIIDLLNPNNKLESAIENLQEETLEKESSKFEIQKINSESEIYKQHNNSMFSKNKNIHPTKIFIDNKLNIQRLINKFNVIKNNNKIFKSLDVETIEDALMITNIFNIMINEKNIINNNYDHNDDKVLSKNIFDFYINKFYFETGKHLFINDKYAEIKNVELRLLNKMNINELKNNKLDSEQSVKAKYYNNIPSKITRLAIDKKDSSYYLYLDISVIFKNSPTDRIPIKDQINYTNNCIGRANILDKLLYNTFGISYKKKFLENKLRKKNDSNNLTRKKSLIKPIRSGVKEDANKLLNKKIKYQSGGNKSLTRKIRTIENKKTLKNLINYYSI
tara:strand:+ start:547 stop:3147 length:2601 start_codon:yes stop_codon:yes gene_type:complete